jgi:gamma-glutamyltranspeptidase/glutathione hydrolase
MIRCSMPVLARTPPQTHQPAAQGPDRLARDARAVVTTFRRAATNAFLASCLLTLAAGLTGGQANDAWRVAGSPNRPEAVLPAELHTIEVRSALGMVAAGSPEAARAGARMLEQGGNAVDAAVAAAFAIGVVNPLDAGLGGQAYVLVHLSDGRDIAIDGSSPVPLRVVPDELKVLKETGFPYGYKFACTPATPAALAYALQRYGTMSLAQVLAPAIELADYGHVLMPHIELIVAKYAEIYRENEFLANLLLKDGLEPWPAEHVYCQPVLAATLRRLATHGVQDFYHGRIADEIAADMAANGGYVSKLDLARVRVTERSPVRGTYRGLEVVAFPYPGGGDIMVEALEILGALSPELLRYDSVDRMHLLLEAARIAFRDAPAGTETPFLDTVYFDSARAEQRASLIRFDRALREDELPAARSQWFHDRDTTHVSVVDRFGHAVALTQSLGDGSGVATPSLGFEYNSLLETFEFCDRDSPNFPKPFATVRSTMTPTILFCNGRPLLVLGAPGSSRIPSTILAVITNVVDRGMPLGEAVAAPRVLADRPNPRNPKGCSLAPSDPESVPKVYLELAGPITVEQADELEARGFVDQDRLAFPVHGRTLRAFGGLTAVMVDPATGLLVGVGDPRRNCSAAAPTRLQPR